MKEVSFIRQNIERWRHAENLMSGEERTTPDELADAYVGVTSDLAFAQSHYPQSRIIVYLNHLSASLHGELYKNKREPVSRLVTFWTREVPLTLYRERRSLLVSLVVFAVSVVIGVVSQLGDYSFARLILGGYYVDMTLHNIENGVPTDVYASGNELLSFLGITINNVRVALLTFAMGIFTSFASGFILMENGIMVGTFQTFFFQHGVGYTSMLAIWLHGTLEISSVVVAGAAGIVMGSGWLMPGTYSRMVSFRRGAVRGLKIAVGTLPIFVVAGFIEGFFSRHSEWPDAARLAIILGSLIFVAYYYVLLPMRLGRRLG